MKCFRNQLSYIWGFGLILIVIGCESKPPLNNVRIRPPRFDDSDPILFPPTYEDVLVRFEQLHQNYIQQKHHQFHHRNAGEYSRYEGSYGLGTWDIFGEDTEIPGNREAQNATTYPLPSVAADIALACIYAYEATSNQTYADLAERILDNFLRHEQVIPVNHEDLRGEEMSVSGAFTNWGIRSVFPASYFLPGRYAYVDNPDPTGNAFQYLRELSVPPLVRLREGVGLDSTGYNANLNIGSIVTYSGESFTYTGSVLNGPHPDATAKAAQAYSLAALLEFPNRPEYYPILSRAAQGLYGFDLQNRWDNPSIEAGSRVQGLSAIVRAMKAAGYKKLPTATEWPIEELIRDMRLRVRMVADPFYPGWFQDWTPGGPIPNRLDWWIIQSGPDFFGTDIIDGKRYSWFLLIHDNYGTNEDNQLWYFSRVLLGLADFYGLLSDEPFANSLKKMLKDFLCQGFNYYLHFQDTTNIPGFKGGIQADAYSVIEFSTNRQNYTNFDHGNEEVIKRYSHKSFGKEAMTYPFPIGLQAVLTAAMNIPELAPQLQPLINSGMNHLLACNLFYQSELEHNTLNPMRNWLAPEVFKTLALYLKYSRQFKK